MNKHIILSLIGLGLVALQFSMTSCESNIDLDAQGIISADGYFQSEQDYENALNGVYCRLNTSASDLWLDAVTDNGLTTHSWNWGYDLGRGIGNSSSSFPESKWDMDYVSVQRANNIISNIDTYAWPGGETNATRLKVLGEAKTLRAYFYLDLVGIFGNIIFYTENPSSVEEAREMTQVEPKVVYDFILQDLEEAIADLPETAENSSKIAKPAARLLRARAAAYAAGYLNDDSYWQITLDETAALLENAPALADFGDLFQTGCEDLDEVILVRTYSIDQQNYWGNWYNNSIGGYCVTTPVKNLVDAYEYVGEEVENRPYLNKDPRFYETIYAPGMELRGKYYNTIPNNIVYRDGTAYFDPDKDYGDLQDKEVSVGDVRGEEGGGEWNKTPTGFTWKKYFHEDETWSTWNSYIVFRYAEAYLLRAEALATVGGHDEEAKALVKVIRDRAGNTNDIDEMISTKYGSLLNLIRNERRVEFADEGLRFFDLRRWGILLDQMNQPIEGIEYRDFSNGTPEKVVLVPATRVDYTDKDFYWPIPQAEMDLSKGNLKQNDGW
jgi:hypothetical protein